MLLKGRTAPQPELDLLRRLFLVDWKHTIKRGETLSGMSWYTNFDGPEAKEYWMFLETDTCVRWDPVWHRVREGIRPPVLHLSEDMQATVRHVIDATEKISSDSLCRLVFSTYAILNSPDQGPLNLPQLTLDYKKFKERLGLSAVEIASDPRKSF